MAYNPEYLFAHSIDDYFQERITRLEDEVENWSDDFVENLDEDDALSTLLDDYQLDHPVIDFDEKTAKVQKVQLEGRKFPTTYFTEPNKIYDTEVIRVNIPYSGNTDLLRVTHGYPMNPPLAEINNNHLAFIIYKFDKRDSELKNELDEQINILKSGYNIMKEAVEHFNDDLPSTIKRQIRQRKERLKSSDSLLDAMGVKRRKDVSESFNISKPLRKKIKVSSKKSTSNNKLTEPTLDEKIYHEILKTINDAGKNLERMPSIYEGKDEETLRDHIIFLLDPNFENASVSGETFNKQGKTDIQIRYDSSVLFISECKFWSGKGGFLSTIDQLLSYLTWRDSKSSIVVFVRNKDFQNVLEQIKEIAESHKEFISTENSNDENWFNFTFCLPDDRERKVKVAVQLFHLP